MLYDAHCSYMLNSVCHVVHIVCCMVHSVCAIHYMPTYAACSSPSVAHLTTQQQQLLMCGKVVDQYSSDSFRLLALAVGVIPDVHKVDLLYLTQEQVELCAMPLDQLSLVVLTNSVREDSKETISQVQDG